MSVTMTTTMTTPTPTITTMSSLRSSLTPCLACGNDTENASAMHNLENEVRILRDKVIEAAVKLADYEGEIAQLKAKRTDSPVELSAQHLSARPTITRADTAPHALHRKPSVGRFSFLSSRKTNGELADLEAALARETDLREKAEKKVTDTENEIEDLSATLFEQANEMVSTERRARAKLEDQVTTLEQRDKDRTSRLDRIDEAVKRLERVKALLAP